MFIESTKLDEWKEKMINAHKSMFLEEGELMPVAIICDKNWHHRVYMAVFEDSSQKRMFSEFIREEIKKCDAMAYMFISETWMTSFDIGNPDEKKKHMNPDGSYKAPSKSPEKKEGLMMVFETKLGCETIIFEIERNGKEVKLVNENRNIKNAVGLFSDVLKMPVNNN